MLLRCWLMHSHGVRLSVLETVGDPQRWRHLKQFVERYGGDLFTQRFMNLGNLRGILHQGVEEYLETLAEEPDPDEQFRLLARSRQRHSAWTRPPTGWAWPSKRWWRTTASISTTTASPRSRTAARCSTRCWTSCGCGPSYDRLAWNLRPVMLAHQVLVRCGRDGAAEIWRNASPSGRHPWPTNI